MTWREWAWVAGWMLITMVGLGVLAMRPAHSQDRVSIAPDCEGAYLRVTVSGAPMILLRTVETPSQETHCEQGKAMTIKKGGG